jgi:glycosyltransferase involved in cell wall biosynthesis
MKVIVARTFVPFVPRAADQTADTLEAELRLRGHEVEQYRFPFSPRSANALDQALALRLLDTSEDSDCLISVGTPVHLLKHSHKVLWLAAGDDPWDDPAWPAQPHTSDRLRDALRNADEIAFRELRGVFTDSKTVSQRLKASVDVDSEILYLPPPRSERRHPGSYSDYVLSLSRTVSCRRQRLAVEALRHTETPVRLILAGTGDANGPVETLRAEAARQGVADRVRILSGGIPEEHRLELIDASLAGLYAPFELQSDGDGPLEFQQAAKAVIAVRDSGLMQELINDGENGILCAPEAAAIAAAMDGLYRDRRRAQKMGEAGAARLSALGITWDHVLDRLLS